MDAATAIAHILTDAGLQRVFRPRLPQSESASMPRSCVVLRRSGGGALQSGYMPTIDIRVDVRCYGVNDVEANELGSQVSRILHNVRDVTTPAGRVMWCRTAGAVADQNEPSTGWPVTLSSWQVYGPFLTVGFGLGEFGTQTFGE